MYPEDASELVAYVMTFNDCGYRDALAWLDKWVPHWRTEEPNKPVNEDRR